MSQGPLHAEKVQIEIDDGCLAGLAVRLSE